MYVLCIRLVHIRAWPHDLGVIIVTLLIISPHACNPTWHLIRYHGRRILCAFLSELLHYLSLAPCATLCSITPQHGACHIQLGVLTLRSVTLLYPFIQFAFAFKVPSSCNKPSVSSCFLPCSFLIAFVLCHIFSGRDLLINTVVLLFLPSHHFFKHLYIIYVYIYSHKKRSWHHST